MKIENSVAVVTGGTSGLGEAVTRLFNSLNCKVAVWDTSTTRGESLSKELGSNVLFCATDVSSDESLKLSLDQTLKKFSRINILINCAGIGVNDFTITKKSVHSQNIYDRVMNVNLIGNFNTCRLIAKEMSKQELTEGERGVIVNVSSINAEEGTKSLSAYSASKGAINGLTLPLARDLASYGIRVNTIAPGAFRTGMTSGLENTPFAKAMNKEILSKRSGNPDEFAHAVKFLVENTYMNGAVIRLDSGIRSPNL